jgi:hypothetical protein
MRGNAFGRRGIANMTQQNRSIELRGAERIGEAIER